MIEAPYFKGNLQYMEFEEQCFDCLNYRSVEHKIPFCQTQSDKEGGFGCTISDMFLLHQKTLTDEHRKTLLPNYKCPMRLTVEQAKIKAEPILQKQIQELKQQVINLKKGVCQQSLFETNNKERLEDK